MSSSFPRLISIIAFQNETAEGVNVGHIGQNIRQAFFVGQGGADVLLKTYFERLYPHVWDGIYYPSRKNSGILVLRCFSEAGSSLFKFQKGKRYVSGDVPLERKLYDGSRSLTPEHKASFAPFNLDGLSAFYEENIKDDQINSVALAFGVPPSANISKPHLCRALALQLKTIIDSDNTDPGDIVMIEYQKLLSEPTEGKSETYRPVSVLYKGDRIYRKTAYRPVYDVKLYEKFTHTWHFENIGEQTWRGRKLYFLNHDTVRPRAKTVSIDIPETPPHKGVVLSVAICIISNPNYCTR